MYHPQYDTTFTLLTPEEARAITEPTAQQVGVALDAVAKTAPTVTAAPAPAAPRIPAPSSAPAAPVRQPLPPVQYFDDGRVK